MASNKLSETGDSVNTADPGSATSKRLIPKEVVRDRLGGIRDATLWRLEKRGDLPKPVKLSPGRVMWIEHEIDALIDARAAARAA